MGKGNALNVSGAGAATTSAARSGNSMRGPPRAAHVSRARKPKATAKAVRFCFISGLQHRLVGVAGPEGEAVPAGALCLVHRAVRPPQKPFRTIRGRRDTA